MQNNNHIHIISGYKFIQLDDLEKLQQTFLTTCAELILKGTILLSNEGININVCGSKSSIDSFKKYLKTDARFLDLPLLDTDSSSQVFQRLKVKIKNEIITFRNPNTNPSHHQAKQISPTTLKTWLDEKRDFILLDTRNQYEIEYGTFLNAINLNLKHFTDFPEAIHHLVKDKPVVMFCTGGIRCEKAALHMENAGYSQVYQLQGGILNYFKQIGRAHYQGSCFVFDERTCV